MNAQIRAEASEWLIEWRTDVPDAAAKDRFAAWLRNSPEHVRAYLELTALWEDASLHDRERKQEIEKLIELAKGESNIVALSLVAAGEEGRAAPRRRQRYVLSAVAASAMLGVAAYLWMSVFGAHSYSTSLGEQRTILLSDGSTLELNALSSVRVRYSGGERRIDLREGQALFRVAPDKNRPFVVTSGETRVLVLGTQFDVHRKRSGTVVTVVEGRVAVSPRAAAAADDASSNSASRPIELGAGQQLTVLPTSTPTPRPANAAAATAWTQKQLVFESVPLPEVAEEFNRFNARKLVVEGGALTGFHVSGTFSAVDPSSLPKFLSFLRDQPGIQLTESDDRIVVTQK